MGVEPTTSAWEANVLPINYIRKDNRRCVLTYKLYHICGYLSRALREYRAIFCRIVEKARCYRQILAVIQAFPYRGFSPNQRRTL